jgi:hypothetical protein
MGMASMCGTSTGHEADRDNCFAEQKNVDAVRKKMGYVRFDTDAERAALGGGLARFIPISYHFFA